MENGDSNVINIKVKTLDNALHDLTVTKETSISELKTKIAAQINIPINRQRIIFQGKMLKNHESIATYKIEDGHVLHLVANPGISDAERDANSNTNLQLQQQNSNGQRDGESSPLADSLADLELISGLIRTLSETTFNRRNLRRRILQQRTSGFNMDVNESLEILRQNTRNIETLLTSATKPSEIPHQDTGYINPFNFSHRKLYIGQWVDVKDTIDQWLEAQVINVRENQAFVHYNGWGARWDEWIDMNSPRIAVFRTHTVQSSNTRYMSPFPNNAPDGDNSHMPPHHIDFPELLEDAGRMMSNVSNTTQKLLHCLHPAQSTGKSEKSEKHSAAKHDMELQNVITGMIEEQKSQPRERENRSEKYVQFEDTQSVKSHKSLEKNVMFEDAQSVKSHKSLDYDAISFKSIKSFISTSDIKTVNPPLNFPEYISEEDSEEISEIQNNVNIPHPNHHLRELQIGLYASQLAPLYDRLGRLMIDLAPHLAMLGSGAQTISNGPNSATNPVNAPNNPNLTFASILTNESGQTASNQNNASNRQFQFQIPVMLTPGEVIAANNSSATSNRIFGENPSNNVEFHIHAILGPLRNLGQNNTLANSGLQNNNPSGSPIRHLNHETRSNRSETSDRREPTRRTSGFTFNEPLPERRRNVQPSQYNPASQPILSTREADRLQPEREFWPIRKTSQDREEENLNEISFGTRRGVETETDNIFVDSDTARQDRIQNMDIDIELNNREPGMIRTRRSLEEEENIFRTPRHSISSDKGENGNAKDKHSENLDSKELPEKEDKRDDNDEDDANTDNDNWNNTSGTRRSNCGRNIS